MRLYRLQDADGRGPFRPGFSHLWVDENNPNNMPPIFQELGMPPHEMAKIIPPDMHCGCACKSAEELHKWFNRNERKRLSRFGSSIVEFEPDVIIADLPSQVLFGMRQPLKSLKPTP